MKLFRKIILSIFLCLSIFLGACGKTPPPTNPNPETEQQGGSSQQGGESQSGGSQSGGGASNSGSGAGDTQTGGNNQGNGDGNQDGGDGQDNTENPGNSGDQGQSQTSPEQIAWEKLRDLILVDDDDDTTTANVVDLYSNFNNGVELSVNRTDNTMGYYDISKLNISKEDWDFYVQKVSENYMQHPFWNINANELISLQAINIDETNSTYEGYKSTPSYTQAIKHQNETYNEIKINLPSTKYQTVTTQTFDQNEVGNYIENNYKYDFSDDEYGIVAMCNIIQSTTQYTDFITHLGSTLNDVELGYSQPLTPDDTWIKSVALNSLDDETFEFQINTLSRSMDDAYAENKKYPYPSVMVDFIQYSIKFSNSSLISIDVNTGFANVTRYHTASDLKNYFKNTGLDTSTVFTSGVHGMTIGFMKYKFKFNEFNSETLDQYRVIPDVSPEQLAYAYLHNHAQNEILDCWDTELEVSDSINKSTKTIYDISETNISENDWNYDYISKMTTLDQPGPINELISSLYIGVDISGKEGYSKKTDSSGKITYDETESNEHTHITNYGEDDETTTTETIKSKDINQHLEDLYKYDFNNQINVDDIWQIIAETPSYQSFITKITNSSLIYNLHQLYNNQFDELALVGTYETSVELKVNTTSNCELIITNQYGSPISGDYAFVQYSIKFNQDNYYSDEDALSFEVFVGRITEHNVIGYEEMREHFSSAMPYYNESYVASKIPDNSNVYQTKIQYLHFNISFDRFGENQEWI